MSFVTVFAGGIALNNVGALIWIWMLLSCAIAVPFVYFMCPEVSSTFSSSAGRVLTIVQTTGKTLEEIDLIFARKELRESAAAKRTIHRTPSGEKGSDVLEEESV